MATLKEKQALVDNWMRKKKTTDLVFQNVNHMRFERNLTTGVWENVVHNEINEENPPDDLNNAILWALRKARDFGSKTKRAKKNETSFGRLRSAYDLWRHLKINFPGLTILDVMNALWEVRSRTGSHFCSTVRRRVFWLAEDGRVNVHYQKDYDEFYLTFKDWEGINHKEIQEAVENAPTN